MRFLVRRGGGNAGLVPVCGPIRPGAPEEHSPLSSSGEGIVPDLVVVNR